MKPDKYEKARQKARTRQALIAAFVVPLTIFLFLHSSFVLNAEPGEHTLVRGSKQECPTVQCATTKGNFSVELQPHLAPNGTAFFKKLVKGRYFDQHIPFFRVNDVITQFGITKRKTREEDPFVELRRGADRDENPYGGLGRDAESEEKRRKRPWKRGTIASIGGFHFVVVIKANRHMGVNRHDAPLGFISEEDMVRVFDRLYKYNDIVDHPHGPPGVDQGSLMREGMPYIKREFPKTDIILGCSCINQ